MFAIVAAVGGAIVSGVMGSKSADTQAAAATSAADTSSEASKYAADLQYKTWQEQQANLKPWLTAGEKGLNQLSYGLGLPGSTGTGVKGDLSRDFTMNDYKADPGYQFRLSEGIKALDRSASAGGNLMSGSALKGVTRYGQEAASQEYSNAYNRYTGEQNTKYNQLAAMAGVGQTTANSINSAGSTYANNAGTIATNNAATQGNAAIAAANAQSSAYGNWGNALGKGITGISDWYNS